MKKLIRTLDAFFAVILVLIYSLVGFGNWFLPDSVSSYSSKPIKFGGIYYVSSTADSLVNYQSGSRVSLDESQIKLFGVVPVKNAEIKQKTVKNVYIGGESFGIKLYTDGVIVVGTKDVQTASGTFNPAKTAGLEKGDVIVEINNVKITSSTQVEDIFNDNNGKEYKIKIKRNGNYKSFALKPVYCTSEGKYKVGVWVRDSTAGIGTVTFYNPENKSIAALGHPITDVDTNEIMPILNGEAVQAQVTKLYKSYNGETGSLCCDFSNNKIADLSVNTNCGIYGRYTQLSENKKLYPVASSQEIKKGNAQLLCTVDKNGAKLYNIDITHISYRDNKDGKNMVVKITDNELIEKTGGIVQGMSGSPIIQDGKIIGALTHVIVDNPQKGYAIFAEKMLEQSQSVN